MSELATLVDRLRLRIGAPPWPVRSNLGPAPPIRQLALPEAKEALTAARPRREIPATELGVARSLLRGGRTEARVEPDPIDIEVLLALEPGEAFQLRQLVAVRPGLARGAVEAWDRVDLAILAARGLEAASVVAGRPRSARWVRDASLVPGMATATLAPRERGSAETWLEAHADLAAAWAVRAALGAIEAERERGAGLIGWLRARGRGEAIDAALARLSGAREDLAAVLGAPFVAGVPYRLPAGLPSIAGDLGAIRLRGGGVIDPEAGGVLIRAIAAGTVLGESAVVSALHREADPESLEDLLLAIFEAWVRDRPGEHVWVLDALARLGAERSVRALVRAHRTCRRKKDVQALDALDALALQGTDLAIFELARVAELETRGAAHTRARRALGTLAAERGTTVDRMIETALPSLDLDARGERPADGAPGWSLVLVPSGPVHFRDPSGAIADAPRGKTGTLLKRLGRELQGDAAAVSTRAARRLERAMGDGRVVSAERLRVLIAHPIVANVVRAVIWVDEHGERFRVAEDGTATTISEEERPLPIGDAHVAHPVTLSEAERARWGELLASYEIAQPFAQLTRRVFTLPEAARGAEQWPPEGDAALPAARVYTLVARGYHLDWGGGDLVKELPDRRQIHVSLYPGFDPRTDPASQGMLHAVARLRGADGQSLPIGSLGPAPTSELLDALRG